MYLVGRGGVEPPFSDFQSGTPTAYVTCPYYKTHKEKIVGFEPTTFCLTDKCSTNELNFF